MPTYDYACSACGPFEQRRPISERDQPTRCPACGQPAARILAGSPGLATCASGMARGIRSQDEAAGVYRRMAHPASCRCC
jgi:putative FmdB family regulatory protein